MNFHHVGSACIALALLVLVECQNIFNETLPALPVTSGTISPLLNNTTVVPATVPPSIPGIPIATNSPMTTNLTTTSPADSPLTLPSVPISTLQPGNFTTNPVSTAAPATTLPITTVPPATPVPGCFTSANCAEGLFCSGLTQQCIALTCSAWSRATPPGELPFSEKPCVAEGYEPGAFFCGWDGKCYQYDCSNWYTYGPVAYTGHDPNNPVPLNCREISDGAQTYMNAVTYGCRPWQPGSKAPESQAHILFFNEKCDATPRLNHTFQCYQNLPSTDYTQFQEAVQSRSLPSCNPSIYGVSEPLYWYNIQARQERKVIVTNYMHGINSTISSELFDTNLGLRAFYAVVVSSVDAPPQTYPPPPTPPPTQPVEESGAYSKNGSWTNIWILVSGLWLVFGM